MTKQHSTQRHENAYYKQFYGRISWLKDIVLSAFFGLSSWPRLVMEVFLRRDFGPRYYTLSSVLTVGVILFFLPTLLPNSRYSFEHPGQVFGAFPLWYLFWAAYMILGIKKWREVKLGPSVFNFEKFSLSAGKVLPFFKELKFSEKNVSMRTIEIYLEPLTFLIAGLLLLAFQQILGGLFVTCAIIYSLSYSCAYGIGDDMIMDMIDNKIMGEDIQEDFVYGNEEGARGTKWYMRKPSSQELREKMAEAIVGDNEAASVI